MKPPTSREIYGLKEPVPVPPHIDFDTAGWIGRAVEHQKDEERRARRRILRIRVRTELKEELEDVAAYEFFDSGTEFFLDLIRRKICQYNEDPFYIAWKRQRLGLPAKAPPPGQATIT
jgi:hypothetical protein